MLCKKINIEGSRKDQDTSSVTSKNLINSSRSTKQEIGLCRPHRCLVFCITWVKSYQLPNGTKKYANIAKNCEALQWIINKKEFQNEQIKVKATYNPGCIVQAQVEVTPLAVKAAYDKAAKNVKKEISIPDFVKAAHQMMSLSAIFGKPHRREWREIVLESAFQDMMPTH